MSSENKEENLSKKINVLPQFAYDVLTSDSVIETNGEVSKKLNLNNQKRVNLIHILMKVFLKDVKIENIPDELVKNLGIAAKEANFIALNWCQKVLFQAKDFFPGIEDEILKLGGEIPKEAPRKDSGQFLKREEKMEALQEEKERKGEEERLAEEIINEPIESLLKNYPKVGEQIIGAQKEIVIKSMPLPMKPMIKYWIADYKDKMGYESHSNIDRVQYVYHDRNTKSMNEEERRQLNLVLKSLDEGISLPYSTRLGKIDFGRVNDE